VRRQLDLFLFAEEPDPNPKAQAQHNCKLQLRMLSLHSPTVVEYCSVQHMSRLYLQHLVLTGRCPLASSSRYRQMRTADLPEYLGLLFLQVLIYRD
jgi:hypothetical protein